MSAAHSADERSHRPARVAILTDGADETVRSRATRFARELDLPLVSTADSTYEMLLTVTDERLELRFPQCGGPRPLYVDFVAGPLGYARRVNRFGLLFQAVGFRSGRRAAKGTPQGAGWGGPLCPPGPAGTPAPLVPSQARLTVLDATAGLGRDAFRLAYHGCRVTAVERSPLLFALLQDGLDRAARSREVGEKLGDRLRLIQADARDVLRDLSPVSAPDVIYLDPMFPPKQKSALVRKEMRILRRLVGDDPDAGELFELARASARKRVVVKRLRHAEPLAPGPSHSCSDKTTRYDVYVRARPSG